MNEAVLARMLQVLTPDIVASLRRAVELGKWPDGRRLTREQVETCLQAVIAWELQNLPEDQRTGYMGPQECASKSAPVPNILFKSDAIH